ncbi:MAG TPA: WD40 repeat domain-containing protein [Ktedonobacterales bacterium]
MDQLGERCQGARTEAPDGLARWAGVSVSRRGVLLAGAGLLLAGCAAQGSTIARHLPTPTPTPTPPLPAITPANAGQLTQIAQLTPTGGFSRGIAWSPDGRQLGIGAPAQLEIWDAATAQPAYAIPAKTEGVVGLAWSPDGARVASADETGDVRLWDVRSRRADIILRDARYTSPRSVAWAPDSRRLASGDSDGTVLLWDAEQGHLTGTLTGPARRKSRGGDPYAAWGVAWSPDGRRLAASRYDYYVLLWDTATGKRVAALTTPDQPNGVAWSPDGKLLAATDDHGEVLLFEAANLTHTRRLDPQDNGYWAYPLSWSPDGTLLACGRFSGAVDVWEIASGRRVASLTGHTAAVWSLGWSPDGLRIASASDDATIRLWGVR